MQSRSRFTFHCTCTQETRPTHDERLTSWTIKLAAEVQRLSQSMHLRRCHTARVIRARSDMNFRASGGAPGTLMNTLECRVSSQPEVTPSLPPFVRSESGPSTIAHHSSILPSRSGSTVHVTAVSPRTRYGCPYCCWWLTYPRRTALMSDITVNV